MKETQTIPFQVPHPPEHFLGFGWCYLKTLAPRLLFTFY